MGNDEKLRLLFVEQVEDDVEHKRSKRINQGAATLLARWPSYVASAIWGIVFILSLITLLMLTMFILLVRQEKVVERNIYIPSKEAMGTGLLITQEIRSEFCQKMTAKSHEKRQNIPEKDLQIFDSGNNIFYVLTSPLNRTSSCTLESVLRTCNDKNIFILLLKKNLTTQYEQILGISYPNLNTAYIDGKKLLKGSPFEGQWNENGRSLFKAALLTVWQFGGTVISSDLFMMSNRIYTENQGDCVVDKNLIFCPQQCAAFIYYLIGETLKAKENVSIEAIIDASIISFCGSEHFIYTGCPGVSRLEDVCSAPDTKTLFVYMNEWKKTAGWDEIATNCPITYKHENVLLRQFSTSTSPTEAALETKTKNETEEQESLKESTQLIQTSTSSKCETTKDILYKNKTSTTS